MHDTAQPTAPPPAYRPLGQAIHRLGPGRNGRPRSISTGVRWIIEGVVLSDGSRLRLEGRRTPGGWVTTDEAVDAFIEAITADRLAQPAGPVSPRATTARTRAAERADRELAAAGF